MSRFKLLCVDDTSQNLNLINEYLNTEFELYLHKHPQTALNFLEQNPGKVDLILLDVMMPELNGYEFCRHIRQKSQLAHLPVIFVSAKDSSLDEVEGYIAGGNDYVRKPFDPHVLKHHIYNQLEQSCDHKELEMRNSDLSKKLEDEVERISQLQQATLNIMVSLAEFRDEQTGNHIRRTQLYVEQLVTQLAPKLSELTPMRCQYIVKAAPLHDIGKITIPDHILLKPSKLSEAEFEIMKSHTTAGVSILTRAIQEFGEYGGFLEEAKLIAESHHEHWNGQGYPYGLSNNEIPLSARIMAVADVYDALRSHRPYKDEMPHLSVCDYLNQRSGEQFDPSIIEAFNQCHANFERISRQLKDSL